LARAPLARSASRSAVACTARRRGLPNIKTVAILPFDNQTAEPALTKEVNDAVLERSSVGSDSASRVRATRTRWCAQGHRYDPDMPAAYRAGQGRTDVTSARSRSASTSRFSISGSKTLWQRQGLSETGDYAPPQEAAAARSLSRSSSTTWSTGPSRNGDARAPPRRGASSTGCLVSLLFLVGALYYGVNIGELFFRTIACSTRCRPRPACPLLDDGTIRRRIQAAAQDIGLPPEASRLKSRGGRRRGRS